MTFFWNNYPETQELDNLSLVTFLSYQDINMIFPSDLKVEGWQKLLEHSEFLNHLKKVNLFVASTYGKTEGYCGEVFKYCRPQLVIISNDLEHPISEEMIKLYANQARGLEVNQANRQLLTTHRDGTITISRYLDSG